MKEDLLKQHYKNIWMECSESLPEDFDFEGWGNTCLVKVISQDGPKVYNAVRIKNIPREDKAYAQWLVEDDGVMIPVPDSHVVSWCSKG